MDESSFSALVFPTNFIAMSAYLQLFNEQQKNALLKTRAAERKLGECVDLPSSTDVATAIMLILLSKVFH